MPLVSLSRLPVRTKDEAHAGGTRDAAGYAERDGRKGGRTVDLQELREISRTVTPELIRFLELSQNADTSIMPIKGDVLVRQGEAARVLNVNKDAITQFVKDGLLTPYYTPNSRQRKFWLSEVKALATKGGESSCAHSDNC